MPAWMYFSRPTTMAYHDLTTDLTPPKNLRSLLGLSLKFIPNPRHNVPWSEYTDAILPRFETDLKVKTFMAALPVDPDDQPEPDKNYNPRMYLRSNWRPPESVFPTPVEIPRRLFSFKCALHRLVSKQTGVSNLLRTQRRALNFLRNQDTFLVVQCDKNLGPAIIEKDRYIKFAFRDHLSDATTYKRLTDHEASVKASHLKLWIAAWTKKHKRLLLPSEKKFMEQRLRTNETPFSAFYATMKVHKSPLKSRPIVSCSGSLLQPLAIWVDDKLQIAAKAQQSYFKNSYVLKNMLQELELPPNAFLFTADAVSMYTNIPTHRALLFIGQHLRATLYPDIPTEALMEALTLVMCNNIFTFGDTTWQQQTGTAMGTPPAPPWATLYYALNEDRFLPKYGDLLFYKRFIDDVIGIWIDTDENKAQWNELAADLNSDLFGLEWIVSPLSKKVDFMDLTLSIAGQNIHTTLYEKPFNLHLYIPPNSCHPPGLLPGIVFGGIHRLHTLCTDQSDIKNRTQAFYTRLLRRGYERRILRPMFDEAATKARRYIENPPLPGDRDNLRNKMLLHLRYHPLNPTSESLQRAWYDTISRPPYERTLSVIKNYRKIPTGIERMIIAYSRPNNLGNILSYRKLKPNGPPVSSYCTARDE